MISFTISVTFNDACDDLKSLELSKWDHETDTNDIMMTSYDTILQIIAIKAQGIFLNVDYSRRLLRRIPQRLGFRSSLFTFHF